LGEEFDRSGERVLQPGAIDRALNVLRDFQQCVKSFHVDSVSAVATGVVREARNRDAFLDRVYEHTGIRVNPITGEEEALLTGKGALNALNIGTGPFLIFDLGGGSTEFFFGSSDSPQVRSVALGAAVLNRDFLKGDPPRMGELDALSRHVDQALDATGLERKARGDYSPVVGTGGTVTTLCAMLHHIALKEISSERINGLTLENTSIEALFNRLKHMSLDERLRLSGLDRERAPVIVAGCMVVLKILQFLEASQLTVSLSDLLEGILID